MKLLSLLSLVLLASITAPNFANAQTCVSKEDMDEVARRFPQYSNLAGKEYCYDGSEEAHLIAGLMFMRQTKFANPGRSRDDLFSGRFANDWFGYFTQRISEFSVDSGCPKGVIAYVYMFGGQTMYACSAALTDQFSPMDLASVFMHEARHMDGFPHITCSSGPRQGLQGACDKRIADAGSYAVTVETYAQLARYALEIHPALRAYARSSAVVYADEAFENPATVDRINRFMVLAKDKRFHSLSTSGITQAYGAAPELGQIVMRSQHMILIPDDRNNKARFVFSRGEGEIVTQAGDQAAEYNALSPADRPSMIDIHIGAQWNAIVYKDKVRFKCDPRSQTLRDIPTPELPYSLVYPSGYSRAARSALMIGDSGKVYEIGCTGTQAQIKPSTVTFDLKYKSVYKVENLVLGLTADGYLHEISGSTSKPYSLGDLDGQIHELVPNQAIDFFGEKISGKVR